MIMIILLFTTIAIAIEAIAIAIAIAIEAMISFQNLYTTTNKIYECICLKLLKTRQRR